MDLIKNSRLKNRSGFTLVELMIVLMVVSIVAALATMGSLAARVRANEGQAQASLKTIATGSEMYLNSNASYPSELSSLSGDYIATDLASGTKSGYSFVLKSANSGSTFTATAVPLSMNYSGVRSFCITAQNAIYVYQNAPALSGDGADCPTGGSILSS